MILFKSTSFTSMLYQDRDWEWHEYCRYDEEYINFRKDGIQDSAYKTFYNPPLEEIKEYQKRKFIKDMI